MKDEELEHAQGFCDEIDPEMLNDVGDALQGVLKKWQNEGRGTSAGLVNLAVSVARVCQINELPAEVYPMFSATAWAAAHNVRWASKQEKKEG